MFENGCQGDAIFIGRIVYKVEFEVFKDPDVTWYVEHGIKVRPDLKDPKLELHKKGSCCGQFERIIYSVFKNDFSGLGKQVSHYAFCRWCGHQLSTSIRNEITTESAAGFQLPFGKHKGKKLSEIPKDYLEWAIKNMDGNIKRKIEVYLNTEK